MKRHTKNFLGIRLSLFAAVIFAVLLVATLTPIGAQAANADSIATQINAVSGLSASVSGSTVTVSGSSSNMANLALNIDGGVTVNWNADVTGRATANNYVLTLAGGGTFNVNSGGTIANSSSSAGGTVYLNGGITLNVNSGGLIDSPTTGSGSAVTIPGGISGAVINVNSGGLIRSVPGGYAINDGSGFTQSANNTQININGGTVEAGTAGAIRSTGSLSVVTVNSGMVTSAPASNVSPVISMNCDPPPASVIENVIIKGGTVQTTNDVAGSYVIQTSQSVLVQGGLVKSVAGRGINLVGENSVATVTGGTVTTVTGTAISTATTTLDKITNASVVVTGGTVEATGTDSGTAINITGYNSKVTVSGGFVLAKQGIAIDASGRPATGSVTVSGGLVYAWGGSLSGVVSPISKLLTPVSGGTVVAWNTTDGANQSHYQNSTDDITFLPAGSVVWGLGSPAGIKYGGDLLFNMSGFINATVIPDAYMLTVVNGTAATGVDVIDRGNGVYMVKTGTTVTITARDGIPINPSIAGPPPDTAYNYPINGDEFDKWTTASGVAFAAESANSTTFTMPSSEATVTAQFKPRYLLHVHIGVTIYSPRNFGTSVNYGYYTAGETILVTLASGGYALPWIGADGVTITGPSDGHYSVTMPDRPLEFGATPPGGGSYTPGTFSTKYTTTTSGGTILSTSVGTVVNNTTYEAFAGTGLIISAGAPTAGKVFDNWTFTNTDTNAAVTPSPSWFLEGSATSPNIRFVTQTQNITLTANYREITYKLTVIEGEGSGNYHEDDDITVTANIPQGMEFAFWSIDSGGGDFDDTTHEVAEFKMPDSNAVITAHFEPLQADDPDNPSPAPTLAPRAPSDTPMTSVRSHMLPAIIVALLSLTGIIVLVFLIKTKNKKPERKQ